MKDNFLELIALLKTHLRKTEKVCQESELEKAGIDAEHWQTIYSIVEQLADARVNSEVMPRNYAPHQDRDDHDSTENTSGKDRCLAASAPATDKKPAVDPFADVQYTIYLPVDGMPHQIVEYGKSLVGNELADPTPGMESAADKQKQTSAAKTTNPVPSSVLPPKRLEPTGKIPQMPNKKVKPLLPPNQRSLKKFKKQWVTQENAMQILGIDKASLERLVGIGHIDCKIINNKKTYPLNDLRAAHGKWKAGKGLTIDSKVVLQQADAELHEDLKHDQELRDLISAATITPEYRYIQNNGGCFICDTTNGNYNAMNIMAIIVDRLGDSDYSNTIKTLAELLTGKPGLLHYTSEVAKREIESGSLDAFIEDKTYVAEMSAELQNDDLLAKYYADLALFRLALLARSNGDLPDHLISLAPKDIFELTKAVKWPPSEQEAAKREALAHYDAREKTVYILQRLCANNPVEFDLGAGKK